MLQNVYPKSVLLWLKTSFSMVLAMVIIGAITRLTDSGLSMVEWRLLYGFLPPLSESEWQRVFHLYKQIPEYQHQNYGMSLEEFKEIFFWEYFHRLWGRLIGIIYAVPLIFFWVKGTIPTKRKPVLGLLLLLGGLQGGIGWWMVKSGFVDRMDVSAFRLMVHFALAIIIMLILWSEILKNSINIDNVSCETIGKYPYVLATFCFILTFITIVSGALVAGNDAGLIYNEWPLMGGKIVPEDYVGHHFHAWFYDQATVQFHHRILAYFTLAVAIGLFISSRKQHLPAKFQKMNTMVLAVVFLQLLLGVLTILNVSHTHLAIAHHINALLLILSVSRLWLYYKYAFKGYLNA